MSKRGNLKQVIESWYYNENSEMSTPNNSLYHVENKLFSYGSHYLLGLKLKNSNYCLINNDKYSSSTGKHQCYTKSVVSMCDIINVSMYALDKILKNDKWFKEDIEVIDSTFKQSLLRLGNRLLVVGRDETLKGVNKDYVIEIDNNITSIDSIESALSTIRPYSNVKRIGMKYFLELNSSLKGEKNFEFYDKLGNKYIASEGLKVDNEIYIKGIVKNIDYKQCKLYDNINNKKWYLVKEYNFLKACKGC